MALVDLSAALPVRTDPDTDPRLLLAARAGRMRGIALDTHLAALAAPDRADGIVRHALRDARALHSRERRLVADGLADLFRYRGVLDALLGGDPVARWLGWLVLRGLPPEAATEAHPGPNYAVVAGLPDTGAHLDVEAVAGVGPDAARALERSLGADLGAFLAASNARAPTCLRVSRRTDVETVLAQLAFIGVEARRGRWAPRSVVIDGHPDLHALPAYRAGAVEVQDEASQLVARLVRPGGSVLDLCAGAGGKTLALADAGSDVVATDVRPLDALRRRVARAGLRVRTERVSSSGPLPPSLQADQVLVDAPCSGSGVLRRHPAYRLRWTRENLSTLVTTQRDLLARAAPLVRPGGRMIYATCSVLTLENEDIVAAFLAEHPGWTAGDGLRTRPDTHGTDGFFGAVLKAP